LKITIRSKLFYCGKKEKKNSERKTNLPNGRKPTTPGEFISDYIIDEFGVTQQELADRLMVSRLTISQLIHNKRSITTDMALRLSKFTKTSPDLWLNMQRAIDLHNATLSRNSEWNKIHPFEEKKTVCV
jgi:antitoxin HigA-1